MLLSKPLTIPLRSANKEDITKLEQKIAKLQEAQHKSEAKLKSTGRLTNLNGRPGK